jgi:hypothetical protein
MIELRDEPNEVHVERLLGRRVRDTDGAVVGRIEELRAEPVDGELVVMEFHLGPAALLERMGRFALKLPFLALLPIPKWEYRVGWSFIDLADADRPVLRCSRRDLRRTHADAS